MTGLLEGKVVLVTGGAQGLGRAMAELFAAHGARIVIGDLDADAAELVVASLPTDSIGLRLDVTDADSVRVCVARAVDRLGRVDVLVNNAGITRDATMRTMTVDDWRAVISVHLTGAFLVTREVLALMRECGSGTVVNISSISGKVGMIGQANYSAAKAGLIGFTKALAKEVAHRGIRVNAIQPGLIRTPMTEALREDVWQSKVVEVPMRRAGKPEEVASAALFFASDMSSYVTGTVLEVTGGRFM